MGAQHSHAHPSLESALKNADPQAQSQLCILPTDALQILLRLLLERGPTHVASKEAQCSICALRLTCRLLYRKIHSTPFVHHNLTIGEHTDPNVVGEWICPLNTPTSDAADFSDTVMCFFIDGRASYNNPSSGYKLEGEHKVHSVRLTQFDIPYGSITCSFHLVSRGASNIDAKSEADKKAYNHLRQFHNLPPLHATYQFYGEKLYRPGDENENYKHFYKKPKSSAKLQRILDQGVSAWK